MELRNKKGTMKNYISPHLYAWKIKLETILLIDSVHIFLEALKDLWLTKSIEGKELYCNVKDSWEHGYSLINSMKTVRIKNKFSTTRFQFEIFRKLLKDYQVW